MHRSHAIGETVDVNKLSDRDKRRAEHIEDKLEEKGLGRDHAEKEALKEVVAERGYSAGGAHAASDTPKHANHERDHRLGTDKKAHSGQP